MPAIPLPFVVALLLVILLVRMARGADEKTFTNASLIFVAVCAVLAILTGLRWSIDSSSIRLIRPVFASVLPPLAWLCFAAPVRRPFRQATPVVAICLLVLVWPEPIDMALALEYAGYGVALIRLAGRSPDSLTNVTLDEAVPAWRAVMIVGLSLVVSGLVDLFVAADYAAEQGTHAVWIVAAAQLLLLVFVALAATAGRSRPEPETQSPPPETNEDDAAIAAAIDRLMTRTRLYRDPDLTLERLARRANIPARRISAALNRIHGRNVSQVVNDYRVAEAKRLLQDTNAPVTTIQFEAGFQTKSNFNREFRRVTGTSPSEYRKAALTGVSEQRPESE